MPDEHTASRRQRFLAEPDFPASKTVRERARRETLSLSVNTELFEQSRAARRKCYDAPYSEQLASLHAVAERGRDARLRQQIRWDMWHTNLLGRPWFAYDHALDNYGHAFGPTHEDDYGDHADANGTREWQPVLGTS